MVVHTLNLAKAGEYEFEANLSYIIILCLKTNKQANKRICVHLPTISSSNVCDFLKQWQFGVRRNGEAKCV